MEDAGDNKDELQKEYYDRHSSWTQAQLSQFGLSINLFTVMGVGALAYLIDHRDSYPRFVIDPELPCNISLVVYLVTIVVLFISVVCGLKSLFSRLCDLRITRHIMRTRIRLLEKENKIIPYTYEEAEKCKWIIFRKAFFNRIPFFKEDDYEKFDEQKFEKKFNDLRKKAAALGSFSWSKHKWQVIFFAIAISIYGVYRVICGG